MPLVFELCRDSRLLNQYYKLREACYRRDLGLNDFEGAEEPRDGQSDLFIAHISGHCMAGGRIGDCSPVHSVLPELDLNSGETCLWERFAIHPAARDPEFFKEFCLQLSHISHDLGYNHALMLSTLKNARFYRRCHAAIGRQFEIKRRAPEFEQGIFARFEHYLSAVHLSAAELPASQLPAAQPQPSRPLLQHGHGRAGLRAAA